MIKEVAIEPEVMATWQYFRELWDDLGVCRGRLVAEYPTDWRDVVAKLAPQKSAPVKAGRILACLKPGPGNCLAQRWVSTNRPYPKGNPNDLGHWLKCAEGHKGPDNFRVIIAGQNPRATGNVLVAGDYLPSHPSWAVAQQMEIPRTTSKLLECAGFLLKNSRELVLVEPNFDATLRRFRDPFEALVGCRRNGQSWNRLEIHVKFPIDKNGNMNPAAVPNQLANAKHFLAPLVPVGNTLQFFFWQRRVSGKRMHARFVLTELGGLQPDYGLDEGDAPGDTTIVSLMAEDVWATMRGDYCAASQTFQGHPGWQADIAGQKP